MLDIQHIYADVGRRTIQVWAPDATTIEIDVQGSRMPLQRSHEDWWSVDVPGFMHGSRYGFVVDGCEPVLPDPRSGWQPDGVHGYSAFVDHSAFEWTDQHWQARPLSSAVIYELHIGTFSPVGTFDGAIERLEHLVDLGVTHVELMPVAQFSGDWGWGYDGVDLYAPHSAYGGPDALKRLVNECHARGLAVILDVVYNHLGPSGNYLSKFAPYHTSRYATPWGDAVNLDGPRSGGVRQFFIENALMWLRDYHFDGLRVDAVHELVDNSACHFAEELTSAVRDLSVELGRYLAVIAESDLNDPRVVRPQELSGYGMDAQWSDDFHHSLHTVLTGERSGYYADFGSIEQLAKALRNGYVYDGVYSEYRRRNHGRSPLGLEGHRFLGYIQNHDQIGNRAAGERISHLVNPRRVKIAAALVFTAPFIPMIFQGEEWAASSHFRYFTQHEDAELAEAVSQGRRSEFISFGWQPHDVPDPQDPETFHSSKLRWDEINQAQHADMLEWYRRLIELRRKSASLLNGKMSAAHVNCDEEARWLTLRRGDIHVVCNFAERAQQIQCHRGEILLDSDSRTAVTDDAVWMPEESVVILHVSPVPR
jgi:maltooligosyltrehalose trehalohydrolase